MANLSDKIAPSGVVKPGDNISTLTNDAGYAASLSDLGVTATTTELNYTDGVTSNIQTQLNGKASTADVASAVPAGTVSFVAMSSAPTGWLKANGAAISRTTYADLFAAIGTTFGSGNGSTTFNLPDLRGEFVRGWDDGRGVDSGRSFASVQAQDWKSFWMTNTGQRTYSYSHNNVWMGKNVTPSGYVGNLFTGYWSAPAAATGLRWNTEEVRPRNFSLLACIKY